MQVRQLEYFLRIAEEGSFSRVTALMDVDQPTLSRIIRRLEEEMETALFHRNGRGVTLTEAGEQFAAIIRPFLAQMQGLKDQIASEREMPRGRISFGLVHSLSETLAPHLLMAFKARFPGVQVHVVGSHSGAIQEWLLNGRIDLGILYDPGHSAGLLTEKIMPDQMYVYGRRAVAETYGLGREVSFAKLAKLPLIMPGKMHGLRRGIESHATLAGIKLRIDHEVDLLPTLRAMVRLDDLFTILPSGAIADSMADPAIYAAPLTDPAIESVLSLAFANNRQLSAATRSFAKFIRAECKNYVKQRRAMMPKR